jgi:hypothetical protein
MAKKLKKGERWVGGLSDCCDAPLKEIGEGITILTCSDCGQMCNKKYDPEEDDFPEDDED